MIHRCMLGCLLGLFILITGKYIFPYKQINASISSLPVNPAVPIDILNLTKEDFDKIVRGRNNRVFLTKGQAQHQVFSSGKPLDSLALSPSQKLIVFSYLINPDISSDEIALGIFDLQTRIIQTV